MASLKPVMKSRHPPFAPFLHFDFCFAVTALNGATGPKLFAPSPHGGRRVANPRSGHDLTAIRRLG